MRRAASALVVAALLIGRPPGAAGQQITGVAPRVSSGATTAQDPGTCEVSNAGCIVILPGGYTSLAVQVLTIDASQALAFESCLASCQTAANWAAVLLTPPGEFAPIATTSTVGYWIGNSPAVFFRVREINPTPSGTSTVTIFATLGSQQSVAAASGASMVPINKVLSATAANTDNHAAFGQVWNWTLTAPNTSGLTFGEAVASTGGTNYIHDQPIVTFKTLSGSSATALLTVCNAVQSGCVANFVPSGPVPPGVGALWNLTAPNDQESGTGGIVESWRGLNGEPFGSNTGDAGIYIYLAGVASGIGTTADCSGCEIGFPANMRGRPFNIFTNNNVNSPAATFNIDNSVTFAGDINIGTFRYTWPGAAPTSNQLLGCPSPCSGPPYPLSWVSAGSATVSSVGFSAPSHFFSVSGSPVTTTGTLALAYASAPTDGQIPIGSSTTSDYAPATITAGAGISVTPGHNSITIASTAGTGAALNAITAASGANTIASGNNSGQVWNWALTSNNVTAFSFGETTAATGGTANNQSIVGISTLVNSTAVPLYIKEQNYAGAPAAFRVDTVIGGGGASTLEACGDGQVYIGRTANVACSAGLSLHVGSNGTVSNVEFDNATAQFGDVGNSFGTLNNTRFGLLSNSSGGFAVDPAHYFVMTRSSAPTTIAATSAFLQLGEAEDTLNGFYGIAFGYTNNAANGNTGIPPAFLGFQQTGADTNGDLVAFTRTAASNTSPIERFRIDRNGAFIVSSTTQTPAVSNTTSNSCGTTAATIAGNSHLGEVTVGATAGTSCTLTFTTVAPVEWVCMANDSGTVGLVTAVPTTTTTVVLKGTFGASDKIQYNCEAR